MGPSATSTQSPRERCSFLCEESKNSGPWGCPEGIHLSSQIIPGPLGILLLEDGESEPCEEVLSKSHARVHSTERAFSFHTLPHEAEGAGEAGGARGGRSRGMLGKASLQKPPTLKFKVLHMPRYPTCDLWGWHWECLNPYEGWRRTKVRAIYSAGIQTFQTESSMDNWLSINLKS